MAEKYKDISGACEWFQLKKQEVEKSQRKVNLSTSQYGGLPLSHQWKPPRLDSEKYQVNQQNIPPMEQPNDNQSVPLQDQTKEQQSKSALSDRKKLKRIHRSYSYDSDQEFKVPKKRVMYQGEALLEGLQTNHDQADKPKTNEKQGQQEIVIQNVTPQLVYDEANPANDEAKLKDYMELADFIMRETHNTHCNGMWLKGSLSGYQEKAMKLLHSYKYNYNLAKFHILYPTVMAIPEQKEEILNSLTDKELENIVNDAVIDMRGCKSQEAEEAIQTIRQDMATNRITVEELGNYQQMLRKLRVEIPDDIEGEHQRSREFSKVIKKKCGPQTGGGAAAQIPNDKKMKLIELLQMQEEALNYPIITAEMQQLQDYVRKAQQWKEKAELLQTQVCQVKQLQGILLEARSIPVNFEGLLEDIKKRCNEGQALVEKIHAQFIKVNKTRTQMTQEQQNAKDKKKGQHHDLTLGHKKDKKHKEQLFKDLLKEAEALMITSSDIQKLRDHLDEVENWKNRASMFLNDEREQKNHKEFFTSLIKETLLFKFEVDLTEALQSRLEFLDWLEKVEDIWARASGINLQYIENSQDEEMKEEEKHVNQDDKVKIEELQTVMQEGEKKGFSDFQIEVIQKVGDLCLRANEFESELRRVLKEIKDQASSHKDLKHRVHIERLLDLQTQSNQIRVLIPESEELVSIIEEVKNFDVQCQDFIQKFELLSQEQPNDGKEGLNFLKEILELRQSISNLGVQNKTFNEFKHLVKPLLRWIKLSRSLIKTYLKSVSSEYPQSFSSLQLLDQQDYDSDTSSDELDLEQDMQIDQGFKMKKSDSDYDDLMTLLIQAKEHHKILKLTLDYQILNSISQKVDNWINRANELNDKVDQQPLNSQEEREILTETVEKLEKLVNEYLPLPLDQYQSVQKQLRREKWLKKLKELYISEKIKIKQVETLAKDSNHADIQEDEKSKVLAEDLKQQLTLCREWLQLLSNSDVNNQKDVAKLIDLGKQLKINLGDFVELRNFNSEVVEWKEKSQRILNEIKNPEFNYEMVRKHIEIGQQLDINDNEIEILKAIVEMCAHWKSLARKILKSRELAKLEVQPVQIQVPEAPLMSQNSQSSNPEEFMIILQKQIDGKFSLVQEGQQLRPTTALKQPIQHSKAKVQYFDNQQYCICRRGDDGFGFMIECDSCKEWFHGDCVGISKQLGNKINQYICIGCARVNFNFDPWNYQQQLQIQQQQKEEQTITENFNLTAFTSLKRASYEDLRTLIIEGQTEIPIYLEEMGELLYAQITIEEWISCIQPILEDPPIESEEEISSADKVFTYTQPNQRKSMDKTIIDIMKLYLESESFPVEHPNAEDLILIMKQRKWFLDAQKILIQNQSATKNNKAVLRKNAKRLIQQFNELRIAHYPNLCQLQRDLQWLLQAQNQPIQQVPMQGGFMMAPYPQHQQQPHFQQQRNQMIQIQGPKKVKPSTHDRKWLPDDFPQNDSYIQRTLNKLFASGNVQYSECANIIEEVELNNLYESDQDREHIMHLKNLLSEYRRWLDEVRECLNKSKKKNETADVIYNLMTSLGIPCFDG